MKHAAPIALISAIFVIAAVPAEAQATRTWVSGVGADGNTCSRTAPCATFAGAISKTAAGGEINCLDPGNFAAVTGAVTITQSIIIDCEAASNGAFCHPAAMLSSSRLVQSPFAASISTGWAVRRPG